MELRWVLGDVVYLLQVAKFSTFGAIVCLTYILYIPMESAKRNEYIASDVMIASPNIQHTAPHTHTHKQASHSKSLRGNYVFRVSPDYIHLLVYIPFLTFEKSINDFCTRQQNVFTVLFVFYLYCFCISIINNLLAHKHCILNESYIV